MYGKKKEGKENGNIGMQDMQLDRLRIKEQGREKPFLVAYYNIYAQFCQVLFCIFSEIFSLFHHKRKKV